MDGYDHLFKLLLIGDAGVGKSRYVSKEVFIVNQSDGINPQL
jgi:hypothetical protein